MEFKDKLLKLRKEKGLSQQELANRLNVSRQSVSKWELGENLPDIQNIIMMSDLFEVSTDYLLKEGMELRPQDVELNHKICLMSIIVVVFGAITAHMLWTAHQSLIDLWIGMLIQIFGIIIFEYFVYSSQNNELQRHFLSVVVWVLPLLPMRYFVTYTRTFEYLCHYLSHYIQISYIAFNYIYLLLSLCMSLVMYIGVKKLIK